MATFNEMVQRLVLEMETRGVNKSTEEINKNTTANENNASAAEANARAQTNFEKSASRASDQLHRMRMRMDAAYNAQTQLNKAVSALHKQGFYTESDIRVLDLLAQKLAKAEGAVNDNAKSYESLVAGMSAFGRKAKETIDLNEKIAAGFRKAAEERRKQAADAEAANKALGGSMSAGMSLYGARSDVGARMGAVGRARMDQEAAASAARVSGMTALMGASGGRDGVGSAMGAFAMTDAIRRDTAAKEDNIAANKRLVDGMGAIGKKSQEAAEFIKKMTGATTGNTAGTTQTAGGLTKLQKLTVQQTLGDVISSLSTGQSPQTILLQQGEQFLQPFGTGMEGIKNAAKTLGPVLLRLVLNPITAIAAATATASYAMYKWQQQTEALKVSLNGLGRASGLTLEGANLVANRAAAASGVSVSQSRDLAGQYLSAGVSGGSIGGAVGLTRDLSRKMGLSMEDASKVLAEALSDPARGAENLAKKFNLVSFAQKQEIERLSDLGDRATATSRLVDDLNRNLKDIDDPTTKAVSLIDRLKVSISDFISRIGLVASNTVFGGEVENEFSRQAKYAQAQKNLVAGKLNEALDRQLGLDKIGAQASISAQEITAQTYAQRDAIAVEKGRLQALLDTKNATQHLMEAEAERLRLLAEAQRKVDDYSRTGARDRAISGARTPYEKGRLQIIQEGQELLRQIPTTAPQSKVKVEGLAPVARPDSGISDLVAEAVRRGLEPTEANFQKLTEEGVGAGKFKGRLVRLNENLSQSTVDMPNINRAAMEKQAQAETAARLQDYAKTQQADFTFRTNQDLEAQNRLLDANTESLGKSTAEVERARKEAELINQAKAIGLPLTAQLNQTIAEQAARYGKLAEDTEKATDAQNRLRDTLDIVRSTSQDIGTSLYDAFRRGENAGKAMLSVLDRLASKLLDKSLSMAIDGLFGKVGGTSGGLIGSIIGSIFPHANGGVMSAGGPVPLMAYANGGVAHRPQMALFGEGSKPEAFVPLPDGRAIPVKMHNQQQGAPKVVINNNASGLVDLQAREDALTGRILVTVNSMIGSSMKKVPGIVADAQRRSL